MICSRIVRFLDAESLVAGQAREALFRDDDNGLILYLSGGAPSNTEEWVVRIEMREALIWLNEMPEDGESFWTDNEQRNDKVKQRI
jgi:hypothetical protein